MEIESRVRKLHAPRELGFGALTGLILATITSSGILAERLARGASWVVMVTDAVTAAAAILVLATTCRWFFEGPRRGRLGRTLLAQASGAVVGVLLVHLAVRGSPLGAYAWLSERPGQLVNDFAAAFGALALIWACAWQPVGALSSLVAVLITVAYAVTAPRWHLDAWGDVVAHGTQAAHGAHAAHGPISVQLAVLVQLACTAVGVSAFHRLSVREDRAFDVH